MLRNKMLGRFFPCTNKKQTKNNNLLENNKMKTQHTQAPWEYDYFGEHVSFAGNDARKDYTFRVEYCATMPEAEQVANSNLIASAPDLLAALRFLLADYIAIGGEKLPGSSIPIAMAREAIAKAEGGAE